jgi:glutathione synthase/RimK-type ligase-like ATP-grasp enzyme
MLNQRDVEEIDVRGRVADGRVEGWLRAPGIRIRLEEVTSVYARPMDDRLLPELDGEPPDSPRRLRSRRLHDAIVAWLDVTPARVVNRFREMGSNGSKAYQAQLVRGLGFAVPETLVTNDPALVVAFRRRHRRVVYKSVSATRSVVHELGDRDVERLDAIRACPVQFQAYVAGFDVRVHVVGDQTIATRVDSPGIDYRYAEHGPDGTRLTPFDLPADVADRCRLITARLGLAFSGIDLRFTPDDDVVCFEVNPSPAYSYYEALTGQPISLALARYLAA